MPLVLPIAAFAVLSAALMLWFASPELYWDEAAYAASVANDWKSLWISGDYCRHHHGPMAIYLAKLGMDFLPLGLGSFEFRARFFGALAGSLGVGLLYWVLRRCFGTSRTAAATASGLLLLSVIRLEETSIIGPHHLLLTCMIAMLGLGYRWRNRPTLLAALGMGAVTALGLLSMTYMIPVALCWVLAVNATGKQWIAWDRRYFRVAWAAPFMLATSAIIVVALWPPGVMQNALVDDFMFYVHYANHATLVGKHIVEVTPRSAVIYWLTHLDAPLFFCSIALISIALAKVLRGGRVLSKHIYVLIYLAFFVATALAAHLAGARNLLQVIGVLCAATGVFFDEALGNKPRFTRLAAAAVIILAVLNLAWASCSSRYTPFPATDGYRAFLTQNRDRLQERAKALVFGMPVLKLYAQHSSIPVAWDVSEMLWTTRSDAPLPADTKYVLIPAFVYKDMPAGQPMRRIVAEQWKVVWSSKTDHTWELRLYENPQFAASE